MRYRRAQVPGGTYFFTVNLADRSSRLLVEQVTTLREAVRSVKTRHPFEIVAWVVLPDHLHAIWTLPPGDTDYAKRWMLIKIAFSSRIRHGERISISRQRKGERGIWQRRYWEHAIAEEVDLQRHVDYIHFNPVKHGYTRIASEWPYSSIHRYIKAGDIPADWGSSSDAVAAGERS